MDKNNKIERLKDALYEHDYKVIKNYELSALGLPLEYDAQELHTERQAIRDEINSVESMTDEEYYEAYPEEREEEILVPEEDLESGDEPYDIDVVGQNNGEEGAPEEEI